MEVYGRLVLDERIAGGRLHIEDGRIVAVDLDDGDASGVEPLIAPGYVDVHVHGWGGHDAMGDRAALDGMARALLRRGEERPLEVQAHRLGAVGRCVW